MGKATELDDFLETRRLTPKEERERREAADSGGEIEGTPDGRLLKRASPSAAPQVVFQAPAQTWD
jgi:hypothetical protein